MIENKGGILQILTEWKETVLVLGLAAFFGVVRYAQDFIVDPPPQFKWIIAIAKTVTAGASGLLAHWLCQEWEIKPNLAAFMIATAGYGGAEALNFFKGAAINALSQLVKPRQ